ncbi:MAG: hypothetical protein J0M26_01935 [Planctomycetes bacterium]|nr:hypothetical protein [Planctomycetota bacterium]
MGIETVTCPVCSGFFGGAVTRLLVKIGDWINVGTEVIEVEDEMAVILIPSNKTGRVVRIHLQPNDRIDWKSPILDVANDTINPPSASN